MTRFYRMYARIGLRTCDKIELGRHGIADTGQIAQSHAVSSLDEIDRRILRVLQEDGRVANNDLAHQVGLSPSPCLRRVRALEEAGLIRRYVAILDAERLGLGQTFFTRIWLSAQDEGTIARFTAAIMALPEVLECYIMLGDCDAMIRVQAPDIAAYRRFQSEKLSRIDSVHNVKSDVPSEIIKQTTALPV